MVISLNKVFKKHLHQRFKVEQIKDIPYDTVTNFKRIKSNH